jgi:Uma2 family endonuclease
MELIMKTATAIRLTNADVESMPDDGNRYELIDGELYVSAAPSFFHQTILANIIVAFADYLREHPIGRIAPGVGVIFDDYNGVIPDLVFATLEKTTKAMPDGRFRAAPEIVIEILSPGASNIRRDRHVKLSLYDARGVAEYWIVDPKNRRVEISRRNEGGDLIRERNLSDRDELTSIVLPDFSVCVDTFFL